jgi:hypothetical protein
MPMEQQSPEMTAAGEKLFKLALERADYGLFCRCCSLTATSNVLMPVFPHQGLGTGDQFNNAAVIDSITEAFISYRGNPQHLLRQLETPAILGHALILKAIGSEAANRIGQAYLEWGVNPSKMCTALLMWTGDHPELAAVTEKITLQPDIAEALLSRAENRLSRPARVFDPAYDLRKRLSAELLSECHVPTRLQEAIANDNQPFAGSLTSHEVTAELHQILGHLEDPHLRRRIKDLIESME